MSDSLDGLAPFFISPPQRVAFLPPKNGPFSFSRSKSLTLAPTFALTIGQSQIYPFFPRLQNALSLSNLFHILSTLASFKLTKLALGLTILCIRRLPYIDPQAGLE